MGGRQSRTTDSQGLNFSPSCSSPPTKPSNQTPRLLDLGGFSVGSPGSLSGCIPVRQVCPLCEKPLCVYILRPLLPRRAKGSPLSEMHPTPTPLPTLSAELLAVIMRKPELLLQVVTKSEISSRGNYGVSEVLRTVPKSCHSLHLQRFQGLSLGSYNLASLLTLVAKRLFFSSAFLYWAISAR